MTERLVAIDPSLTGTCLFDGEEYVHIKDPGSPDRPFERLEVILEEVTKFVWDAERAEPSCTGIIIEAPAFSRAQHAHAKGELHGVLRWELVRAMGIPVWLMLPNLRAKYATGKGNAAKPAVVSATSARTGIVFPTDDHCDAFLLWCAFAEMNSIATPMGTLPKSHRVAIDNISPLV